jgi:hypothetical protein
MSQTTTDSPPLKRAFVIAPIGPDDSPQRRRLRGLQKVIFEPVFDEFHYTFSISCDESKPGSITKQIVIHLFEDDLIVCDLTDLNPNVMFELGVRYTFGKPVVLIAENEMKSKLPFDINQERVVWYKNDAFGIHEIKEQFKSFVQEAEKETLSNNFVREAVKEFRIIEESKGDPKYQFEQMITEKLNVLTDKVDANIIKSHMFLASSIFNNDVHHQRGRYVIDDKIVDRKITTCFYNISGEKKEITSFLKEVNNSLGLYAEGIIIANQNMIFRIDEDMFPREIFNDIIEIFRQRHPSIKITESTKGTEIIKSEK